MVSIRLLFPFLSSHPEPSVVLIQMVPCVDVLEARVSTVTGLGTPGVAASRAVQW